MSGCRLCPRSCGIDRSRTPGYCGVTSTLRVARAALHHWEEPCISGERGSGTVFFSGCPLRCIFCQNHEISTHSLGREITTARLSEIFHELAEAGAHNINLVSPTQYTPQILEAMEMGMPDLPVVWNTGGYEKVDTLRTLAGRVDIYLPDFKYAFSDTAARYSCAPDYPEVALAAIGEMVSQTGKPQFGEDGMLKRGVILRHLVLPGHRKESIEIIRRLAATFSPDDILLSIMSQYTPYEGCELPPELRRRVCSYEYDSVVEAALEAGFGGFMQDRRSAKEEYTPDWDFSGV